MRVPHIGCVPAAQSCRMLSLSSYDVHAVNMHRCSASATCADHCSTRKASAWLEKLLQRESLWREPRGGANIQLIAFDLAGLVLDERIHAGGRQIKHNSAAKRDKGATWNLDCTLAKAKRSVGFHHKHLEFFVLT